MHEVNGATRLAEFVDDRPQIQTGGVGVAGVENHPDVMTGATQCLHEPSEIVGGPRHRARPPGGVLNEEPAPELSATEGFDPPINAVSDRSLLAGVPAVNHQTAGAETGGGS